jgi:hypothetical protein
MVKYLGTITHFQERQEYSSWWSVHLCKKSHCLRGTMGG